MATATDITGKIPVERLGFRSLLVENPNYFGSLLKTDALASQFKPVKVINGDTTYEQLTCIGYDPATESLTGIVNIKLNSGYDGGPCTAGSQEYIRFFINYNNGAGWQDLGAQSINVHDVAHTGKDPLDYAVNFNFQPTLENCCFESPVLPTVRGILSWSILPTAGNPNYVPVWGNALDVDIQVAPRTSLECLLLKGLSDVGVTLAKDKAASLSALLPAAAVDVNTLKKTVQASKGVANLAELVKAYGKNVEPERSGFTAVVKALSNGPTLNNKLHTELNAAGLDISKIMSFIKAPKFNTTYEDINCVGLNVSDSVLNATINIKKNSGFAGGLCTAGSREYVAFYMDFQNGAGWVYMGTSSVGVHDISPMPGGGLCYNVQLPVFLTPYQKASCKDVYLAKVRAILSWDMLPPANSPDWVAPWGNWKECWVEIQNANAVVNGAPGAYILEIGTIMSTKVNTASGLIDKTLGTPDATIDQYNGFSFTGAIPISGTLYEPNGSNIIPGSNMPLQYQIWLKNVTLNTPFALVTGSFDVLQTTIVLGVPNQNIIPQVPDASGWYNYLANYDAAYPYSNIFGDLLGVLTLPDSNLYEFYITTNDGRSTSHYRVNNDNSTPVLQINIDGGQDCGTLIQGANVTGTYSISDAATLGNPSGNCYGVSFEMLYLPSGTPNLTVDGVAESFGQVVLEPIEGFSGVWQITTSQLTPCGYNIRIYGYDKTLYCYAYNNYSYTYEIVYNYATMGFCLAKA